MKQHIDYEQLDEINSDQKKILFKSIQNYSPLSIGQMIEFVISRRNVFDFHPYVEHRSEFNKFPNMWEVEISIRKESGIIENKQFLEKELVDALWEACKYLLKN